MAISSTRKVGLSSPNKVAVSSGRAPAVEDIDTSNNVLVGGEAQQDSLSRQQFDSNQNNEFSNYNPNMATNLEALTLSGIMESEEDEKKPSDSKKINVYSNNQSIVKDDDVERIGRSYLKKFYEDNQPITDVNKLV